MDGSENEDEKYYYDPDTLDILWLLYENLENLNIPINTDEARLDYIEDFVFFMYPYFIFLGEASFNIGVLQIFHDRYYIIDNPLFGKIIDYYVKKVIIPRENPREQISTVVLSSNQRVFLDEFGLNNSHITSVETRMKDTIVTTFENELSKQPIEQNIAEQDEENQKMSTESSPPPLLENHPMTNLIIPQYQFHTGKPPETTKRNKTRKIPRKIKSLQKKREWVKSADQRRRNKTKRKPPSYSRMVYNLPHSV